MCFAWLLLSLMAQIDGSASQSGQALPEVVQVVRALNENLRLAKEKNEAELKQIDKISAVAASGERAAVDRYRMGITNACSGLLAMVSNLTARGCFDDPEGFEPMLAIIDKVRIFAERLPSNLPESTSQAASAVDCLSACSDGIAMLDVWLRVNKPRRDRARSSRERIEKSGVAQLDGQKLPDGVLAEFRTGMMHYIAGTNAWARFDFSRSAAELSEAEKIMSAVKIRLDILSDDIDLE